MTTGTSIPQSARAGIPERGGEAVLTEALKAQNAPIVEGQSRTRDMIVLLMMGLVSVAIGATLHLQGGFSVPMAAFGGAVALAVSLTANALAARNNEVSRLRFEIARLEMELARLKTNLSAAGKEPDPVVEAPAMRPAALPPEARWDASAAARRPRTNAAGAGPATAAQAPHAAAPAPAGTTPPAATAQSQPNHPSQAQAQSQAPRRVPSGSNAPREAQPGQERQETLQDFSAAQMPSAATDESMEIPAWAAPSAAQADAMREDWEASVHDSVARQQTEAAHRIQSARAETPRSEPARAEAPRMPAARTIEADLELVQRKIKALADEVNANEALRNAAAPEVSASASASAAIDDSVAALRTAADRMKPARKGFSARPIYTEAPAPTPKPAPMPPAAPKSAAPNYAQSGPAAPGPRGPSQGAAGGAGTLPSLDALIPATAQPIAVSPPQTPPPARPAASAPAARQEREVRSERDMLQDREAWARDTREESRDFAPATEPPRQQRQAEPVRSSRPEAPMPQVGPQGHMEPAPQTYAPSHAQAPAPDRRTQERRFSDKRVAEIAAALEQRRMDVFLNPIVGLGDYAVTHFEVDVRLRAEGGGYITDAQETLSLDATDLLALFDIERLARTAQVGEQLEARGKTGSLLSPTAGHSMTNGKFLEAFAQTFEARTSISGQLVLTFKQSDVEGFGPSTWQALSDMHSFGFRFALEGVSHLGMDFALLADRGFAFVKLPSEAFLDGLPAGHGMVPPADICRHLSGAGMTLVVEAINDDQLLARVFGFGALFGQGTLFGGSRQITLEALGPKRAA